MIEWILGFVIVGAIAVAAAIVGWAASVDDDIDLTPRRGRRHPPIDKDSKR